MFHFKEFQKCIRKFLWKKTFKFRMKILLMFVLSVNERVWGMIHKASQICKIFLILCLQILTFIKLNVFLQAYIIKVFC